MPKIKDADLNNPIWRLNNLYSIQDKTGYVVPFVPNEDQVDFVYTSRQGLNFVLKRSRQKGLTSIVLMLMLDKCLSVRNTKCGLVELTYTAACNVLSKIKIAYDKVPAELKKVCPLVSETSRELVWANGSTIYTGISIKKDESHDMLSISEFDTIQERLPILATDIEQSINGSMAEHGRCFISSDAESPESILRLHDMAERNSNGINHNGFFIFG